MSILWAKFRKYSLGFSLVALLLILIGGAVIIREIATRIQNQENVPEGMHLLADAEVTSHFSNGVGTISYWVYVINAGTKPCNRFWHDIKWPEEIFNLKLKRTTSYIN